MNKSVRRKRIKLPPLKWVLEHFRYHPDGYLVRLKPVGAATKTGEKVIGCLHHTGYRYIKLKTRMVGIHRAIFFIVHGYAPYEIDHIDRNKLNNKIGNLRPAESHQNSTNKWMSEKNTSGTTGVYKIKNSRSWDASIMFRGHRIKLGQSPNKKIAAALYAGAEKALRGEFAYAKRKSPKTR